MQKICNKLDAVPTHATYPIKTRVLYELCKSIKTSRTELLERIKIRFQNTFVSVFDIDLFAMLWPGQGYVVQESNASRQRIDQNWRQSIDQIDEQLVR